LCHSLEVVLLVGPRDFNDLLFKLFLERVVKGPSHLTLSPGDPLEAVPVELVSVLVDIWKGVGHLGFFEVGVDVFCTLFVLASVPVVSPIIVASAVVSVRLGRIRTTISMISIFEEVLLSVVPMAAMAIVIAIVTR
jgi:hypothetical protein